MRPEPQPQRSERTSLIERLTAAQAHWIAVAPMSYQLTVSRRCFCDPGAPLVSRVAGVTVAESMGGHLDNGRNWGPPLRTVELLFVEARRAAYSDADDVEVSFDPELRYPTRIAIDQSPNADDELEYFAEVNVVR